MGPQMVILAGAVRVGVLRPVAGNACLAFGLMVAVPVPVNSDASSAQVAEGSIASGRGERGGQAGGGGAVAARGDGGAPGGGEGDLARVHWLRGVPCGPGRWTWPQCGRRRG
jgi:hypothetical protein